MDKEELFKLHELTSKKCLEIMKKKNNDYTGGNDSLRNFKMSTSIDIAPEKGLLLRVMDKMQRINTFISTGELKVENESAHDAVDDIINYMVLLKALMLDTEGSS